MARYRGDVKTEPGRDLRIAESLGNQPQDFQLSYGQPFRATGRRVTKRLLDEGREGLSPFGGYPFSHSHKVRSDLKLDSHDAIIADLAEPGG